MQISEEEIRKRQRNLKEKTELLKELGLDEELSSASDLIEDKEIQKMIKKHDYKCSYNACPLNFLTFGLDEKDELIQFRTSVPGDHSKHCTPNRKTRELIYSQLPPILQDLLPNKALADYEIAEDKKIAAMSPEEREAYLKAKEEHMQKYREAMNALKNKQKAL